MSQVTIKSLLEKALNALSVGLDTAFENVPFSPTNGVPHQRVFILPSQTQNPTMGDGFKRESGVMQVTLCYPSNAGAGAALERAEALRLGFKRGTTFTQGTLRVLIDSSPYVSQGASDGAWYMVPVSIPYVADVYGS